MTQEPQSGDTDERPATYREVFTTRDVAALFGSYTVSKASSMLGRVAVTFLVFEATSSPLLSAAAFGISYAPYLGPAQLLAALADRLPYRTTMVVSDLLRMVLIGLIALPGMPLPVMLILLFASAMVEPAYESSRSALLPKLVSGEVLTLALSVYLTLNQAAQLSGYFLGGAIAAVDPRVALIVNSAGFAVSGLMLLTLVRHRPPDTTNAPRKNLVRESAEGFSLVFRHRILRMIALVVFVTMTFTIIPEGAAAAWSDHLGGGALLQGTIMAAAPLAAIVSSVVMTRFLRARVREQLIKPLVLLGPLVLVPALWDPPGPVVVLIAVGCNLAMAPLAPMNAAFVKTVPDGYRARAFSVMQSGMALIQGAAVVAMGALAQAMEIHRSVGVWGVCGLLVVAGLLWWWPSRTEFNAAENNKTAEVKPVPPPESAPRPVPAPEAGEAASESAAG